MTKRLKAPYHRNALLEQRLEPDAIPPGDQLLEELRLLPQFVPRTQRHHDVRCTACRTVVQVGDTVFIPHHHVTPPPHLCYRCGIAWERHCNRMTYAQARDLLPIAGPYP